MKHSIHFAVLAGLCGLGVLLGCESKSAVDAARYASPADAPAEAFVKQQGNARDAGGLTAGEAAASPAADVARKIIYTANVELAVEDFTGVPEQVVALVKKFDAYVAGSNLAGPTGESRRGTWTVRVPVARFEEFVSAAKGLGEVVSVGTNSRDVSEEYYDVEARIRNKTKEEQRLLALLEERPGKLEDVIAIERELSRVREELERMQGRMRVLEDLTSLTTVELAITEIRDYEPPQAPTLATRVRRTFAGSIHALQSAGEGLLLAVVGIAPCMPIAVLAVVPVYVFAGRRRRKSDRPHGDANSTNA